MQDNPLPNVAEDSEAKQRNAQTEAALNKRLDDIMLEDPAKTSVQALDSMVSDKAMGRAHRNSGFQDFRIEF